MSYFLISLGALAVSTYIFSQLDPLHPQFQMFAFVLGFIGITYFGWLPAVPPGTVPDAGPLDRHRHLVQHRAVAALVVLSAGFLLDQFSGDYARVGLRERDDLRRRNARHLVRPATSRRQAGGLTWKRSA